MVSKLSAFFYQRGFEDACGVGFPSSLILHPELYSRHIQAGVLDVVLVKEALGHIPVGDGMNSVLCASVPDRLFVVLDNLIHVIEREIGRGRHDNLVSAQLFEITSASFS